MLQEGMGELRQSCGCNRVVIIEVEIRNKEIERDFRGRIDRLW